MDEGKDASEKLRGYPRLVRVARMETPPFVQSSSHSDDDVRRIGQPSFAQSSVNEPTSPQTTLPKRAEEKGGLVSNICHIHLARQSPRPSLLSS